VGGGKIAINKRSKGAGGGGGRHLK
jgi:hypothetical protein